MMEFNLERVSQTNPFNLELLLSEHFITAPGKKLKTLIRKAIKHTHKDMDISVYK